MIDEKQLIEDFKNTFSDSVLNQTFGFGKYTFLEAIEEMINRQPQIVTDTNVGSKWIPCSERLPPIDMSYPNAKDYLVYYEHGYYDVASYSNIDRFWHEHTTEPHWICEQYCKVVAWMPLPEPYKEDMRGGLND